MTDGELLQQFREGSQQAFSQLVERHLAWVHAAAFRRVGNSHMADDVTQAVFVALAQNKRAFKGAEMSAWMFRVIQYASANLLRSERRRTHHERAAAEQAARSESVLKDQTRALVSVLDRAVERLGSHDLQAILLRFYEQKSLAEIAVMIGVTEEAAKKRISRALVKLKSGLSKDGVTIPANALGAAISSSLAPHAASAPVPPLHLIIQSSVHANQSTQTVALAKSAVSSLSLISVKIAAAVFAILVVTSGISLSLLTSQKVNRPAAQASKIASTFPATNAIADLLTQGDRLKITMDDLVGPGRISVFTPLVDSDGSIAMPLVPPVPAAGQSTGDLEAKIRAAYFEANLIRAADVKVERIERSEATLAERGEFKPGDHVICHLCNLEGPGKDSRLARTIAADGTIELPFLHQLTIAGDSERTAAGKVNAAYRKANLISNALAEVVHELPASASTQPTPFDIPAVPRELAFATHPSTMPFPAMAPNFGTPVTTMPASGPDAQSFRLWKTLCVNRQLAKKAIRNFDVHYVFIARSLEPLGTSKVPTTQVDRVHLIESGEKYFEECKMDWIGQATPSSIPRFIAVAFDGRLGWTRETQEIGTVVFGTNQNFHQMPSPGPLESLSFAEPEHLNENINNGIFKLLEVREEHTPTQAMMQVKITSGRNGGNLSISYSIDQGFTPVHMRDVSSNGSLAGEHSFDQLQETHGDDGIKVFFPIHMRSVAYSKTTGKLIFDTDFRVDPASLRVNREIPNSTFEVIPLPGEKILNGDTGRYVSSDDIVQQNNSATTQPR